MTYANDCVYRRPHNESGVGSWPKIRNVAIATAVAVALQAGTALAQSRQSGELEEVVVSAQKAGEQSLQSVPLAVQAFGGEALKEMNISSIQDLVTAVPGAFEGQRQSAASRSYNLRGAGGSNANGDSPIGYYLDDVPFIVTNFGIAPPVRFLDIQRVEVLRGPQGTLYGQGSSGGVFIFRTRDPDLHDFKFIGELEGGKTVGAESENYGFAAGVSLPIIEDKLAVRISGGHSRNPGWADAYFGPYDGTPDQRGVNTVRNDDVRIVTLYKPVENVSLRAQYWRFQPRQDFTGFTASVDPPYFQNTAGQSSFANGDFELWSLTANVDFESFAITSATSNMEGAFGINIPLSPSGSFSSQFFPKMFAQELRANSTGPSPLHWVAGVSYQDGEGPQANLLVNPAVRIVADNNTITRNYAVFGELSYDLFDGKIVPLIGGRHYHDKRTFADATSSLPSEKNVNTWRGEPVVAAHRGHHDVRHGRHRLPRRHRAVAGASAFADSSPVCPLRSPSTPRPRRTTRSASSGAARTVRSPSALNAYKTEYEDLQTNTPGAINGVNGFSNFGDATSKAWTTSCAGARRSKA